jgi:hypothetical protein
MLQTMASKTKVGAVLFILLVGLAALVYKTPPCFGLRDCYRLLVRIEDGRSNADEYRNALMHHFAASSAAIAFSVPVDAKSGGLVVIDRRNSTQRLIAESGAFFRNPYLSADGQRLVMVKSNSETRRQQLISCETATWRCTVLLNTDNSIMSPVEIGNDTILFSSAPMFIRSDGSRHYSQYDLYIVKKNIAPVRLTDFKVYEMGYLSAVGGKIVFGAQGPNNGALPKFKLDQTEIYSVDFDPNLLQVRSPSLPLTPLFEMSTLSIRPSLSDDGKRIAFLNVEKVNGARYRYDMAVTTLDGHLQQRINLEGIGFSRGIFVADTLIFNELFKDYYQIKQLDLATGNVADLMKFSHSDQAIERLDRINLRLDHDSAGL